jgi:serine/threonine-protein kinase
MPELVGTILQGVFPPVTSLRSDVPLELVAVIDRCLQKERERRFQNVAELARALGPVAAPRYLPMVERIEGVLGLGPPSSAPAPATTGPAVTHSATAVDNRTLSPTTTSFVKKRQPLWVLVPVVLAAAGGGAFYLKTRHEPPAAQGIIHEEPTATIKPVESTPVENTSPTTTHVETPLPISQAHTAFVIPHATHAAVSGAASVAPPPTASPTTTVAPAASSAPACKTVKYFDAQGEAHFKRECP